MQLIMTNIAAAINGRLEHSDQCSEMVNHVLTDSRKLVQPESTLFFALKTQHNDGHFYIDDLLKKGVHNFIVSHEYIPNSSESNQANWIFVEDTLKALQQLAADYRNSFNIPVIGITGSNGKTIVKEWLFSLLSRTSPVLRSPKSYNSQIGVPLSVLLLEKSHQFAIFEAGISQKGEMESLQKIIRPAYGIFTHIGPAHDENFSNSSEKVLEKLILFKDCSQIVMSSANSKIIQLAIEKNRIQKKQLFLWGKNQGDHLRISNEKIEIAQNYTQFTFEFQKKNYSGTIPFTDSASLENAMSCLATLLMLGYNPEECVQMLQMLQPVAMRLEMHDGNHNCLIINDSYNSDLHSLTIALDFLKQQQQQRKSMVILSDMLQTGKHPNDLYKEIAVLLKARKITSFIGIGTEIQSQQQCFQSIEDAAFYKTTDEFLQSYNASSLRDVTILIKGARFFEFEKIVQVFEKKTHQTVLEIHFNALLHNLNVYRAMLPPSTGIMAMVKAFSYGSGSYEIASLLQYHHVSYLGVAYADEGVELRKNGITIPIMVMAPEEAAVEQILINDLEPEIYNLETLQWFKNQNHHPLQIHLKLDTGMHRLGFREEELEKLCTQLASSPSIAVSSIFSHLSAADDPKEDQFTLQQIQCFEKMYNYISETLGIKPKKHILNSAGISRFPQASYDMVRLGLGLYGIQPSKAETIPLVQAASLKTHIIQIKSVHKNDRIGYGYSYTAKQDMKIAVIPLGYADGFRRSLSNGKGRVWVNGQECLVIGNICMDMTIIDITGLQVQIGDSVIIFNQEHSISQLAKEMNVIPYEVITGISARVKRQYLWE